jgi:hypothetical protein
VGFGRQRGVRSASLGQVIVDKLFDEETVYAARDRRPCGWVLAPPLDYGELTPAVAGEDVLCVRVTLTSRHVSGVMSKRAR